MSDSSPLRILIAEDSPSIAERLRYRLETELGFECLMAKSCAEAVQIMESEGPGIFLALLDLVLPDAPQGEIVDIARIRRIPSVVFTSKLDAATRKRILSKDVIDYIVKDANAVDNIVYTVERLRKNRNVKLLVVDDSSSMRSHIKGELRRYMFQVFEASGGITALRVIERNPDITLALVDYRMPDMDGVQLTSNIRTRFSHNEMSIIGLSAISDKPLSVEFIKSGANDFLNKPFQREELYCRVVQGVENIEQFARLRQLDLLKNRFLGMAAHDLRNPINGIKGLSNMLLQGMLGTLSPEQCDIIKTIESASLEMLQLVNDLLDVSMMESGKLELDSSPANLTEIIRKRLSFAELNAAKKSITLAPSLSTLPDIELDKDRIGQVIDNLLSNAIKYSPENTRIEIVLNGNNHEASLCIKDQGPGIPHEEQKDLFRSFRKGSVKPTAGETSTGLGLTIVKRIVTAHKGRVWVESAPGKGSAFYVTLPIPSAT